MDWDNLKLFLQVARAGSFSAAAEGTPLSQPTVSRKILILEQTLDTKLFHRLPRGIRLTSAGESIFDIASQMETSVKRIEITASEERSSAGHIRIVVTYGLLCGYFLPPKLVEFQKIYPGLTFSIHCSHGAPKPGTLDYDIIATWSEPSDPDQVILVTEEMIFRPYAAETYLRTHGTPKKFDDLRTHRICDHTAYPRDGEWTNWANLAEDRARLCFRTSSSMALAQMTIHGAGISLQPTFLRAQDSQGLVMLDLEGFAPRMRFWLTAHKDIKDIPRIRLLVDFLRANRLGTARIGSVGNLYREPARSCSPAEEGDVRFRDDRFQGEPF